MNKQKQGFAPILIILLIVGVIGIIFLVGKGKLNSIIKTETPITSGTPNQNGLLTYKSSKLEKSSFPDFSITYPADWKVTETKNSFYDKTTTLSKNNYSISINQHIQSGIVCLFSDSPVFNGPSQDLKSVQFTELKTESGKIFRRYLNKNSFSFCEGSGGTFGSPTSFGNISYNFPSSYDTKTITEMDNIIKTLTVNQ